MSTRENTEQTKQSIQLLLSDISLQRNERLVQLTTLERSLDDLTSQVQLITTRICKPDGKGIVRSCTDEEFRDLTEKVSQLALTERRLAREEAILRSLDYAQRPVRYETIPDAHMRTFSWIFDRGSASHGFAEWLEAEGGIYWVTGKPGSGKSTLMKYILHHPKTTQLLSSWSTSTPVVIASHFFWSAGLPIQRTREGLLRSLLYDIISRVPELISKIYEENPHLFGQRGRTTQLWTVTRLEDVLRQVTAQKALPMRFCFFIDGLDEYEGNTFDICRVIQDLCSSPDIKMCVASRPWNVFEACLGENAAHRLPVHTLTHDDIRNYVESELSGHPKWNSSIANGVGVPNLVREITKRAEGVFLWVFLVTRMLREGLTNDDSLDELRMRLDSVPTDLGKFFKHILGSVEPSYRERQSGTLQLASAADEPLHAHLYSFHDLEYTYENYAIDHDRRYLTRQELTQFHMPCGRRLNSRCKGLLEIRKQKVEFLHRTVRDFFRTREMTDYFRSNTKDSFNPYLSIFRAHVAWLKSRLAVGDFHHESPHKLSFSSTLSRTLDYAQAAAEQNERCQDLCSELLDDLELSVQTLILSQGSRIVPTSPEDYDAVESADEFSLIFRHAVIQKQLAHFVLTKMGRDLDYFEDLERGPLLLALESYSPVREVCSVLTEPYGESKPGLPNSTKLLRVLLENDCSPNKTFILNPANGITTPWSEFMSCMVPWNCNRDLSYHLDNETQECFLHALKAGVFHMLLQHGADPNAKLPNWKAEDRDDYGLTIGVMWIFLGLKVPGVWKHSELYLRDLEIMIKSGADFADLNMGGSYSVLEAGAPLDLVNRYLPQQTQVLKQKLQSTQDTTQQYYPDLHFSVEEQTLKDLQNSINMSVPSGQAASGKKFEQYLARLRRFLQDKKDQEKTERLRGLMARQTRWGLLVELLENGGAPGEKVFQARLIAELAKADQKRILDWEVLEPTVQSKFPKDIGHIILKAIHGQDSTTG